MAKNYYELHVAGCTRQLPILPVSDTLSIAGFVILGDTEIVQGIRRTSCQGSERHRYHNDR